VTDEQCSGFKLKLVIPGVALILCLELLILFGVLQYGARLQLLLTILMVVLPWAALMGSRQGLNSLGFSHNRFFLHFGWGMVAGGIWRIGSILLNLWSLELSGWMQSSINVLNAIAWVPFVEETFFRAYIGCSIAKSWGKAAGILIQALLFTMLPSHINQGASSLVSIFTFGLLAGWLIEKRRSIWVSWGAHAFANLLPLVVLMVY
jgi:membrane protease YdiL (CAAX protease family)